MGGGSGSRIHSLAFCTRCSRIFCYEPREEATIFHQIRQSSGWYKWVTALKRKQVSTASKCAGKERDSSQKEKHETNFPSRPFGNCFNCRCPFACRGSWRNVYVKMRQGRRGPFCVEPRGPVVALVRSKQKK